MQLFSYRLDILFVYCFYLHVSQSTDQPTDRQPSRSCTIYSRKGHKKNQIQLLNLGTSADWREGYHTSHDSVIVGPINFACRSDFDFKFCFKNWLEKLCQAWMPPPPFTTPPTATSPLSLGTFESSLSHWSDICIYSQTAGLQYISFNTKQNLLQFRMTRTTI